MFQTYSHQKDLWLYMQTIFKGPWSKYPRRSWFTLFCLCSKPFAMDVALFSLCHSLINHYPFFQYYIIVVKPAPSLYPHPSTPSPVSVYIPLPPPHPSTPLSPVSVYIVHPMLYAFCPSPPPSHSLFLTLSRSSSLSTR